MIPSNHQGSVVSLPAPGKPRATGHPRDDREKPRWPTGLRTVERGRAHRCRPIGATSSTPTSKCARSPKRAPTHYTTLPYADYDTFYGMYSTYQPPLVGLAANPMNIVAANHLALSWPSTRVSHGDGLDSSLDTLTEAGRREQDRRAVARGPKEIEPCRCCTLL